MWKPTTADTKAALAEAKAEIERLSAKIAEHERIEAELQKTAEAGAAMQAETIKQLLQR